VCLFYAGAAESIGSARSHGICRRRYGGGFIFQSAHSGAGAVGAYGTVGISPCGYWFRCGCGISPAFGSHHSTPAHERGNGGRTEESSEEDDDAYFGGDAP